MNYFIAEIKLKGYKRISEEMTINFCNSTVKEPFNVTKSNIKGILGTSASGKSAIIESLATYKYYIECVLPQDKLTLYRYIYQSVNQILNEFSFEITFICYEKEKVKEIIKHGFTLYKSKNDLNVSHEYLATTTINKSIKAPFKTIIETVNGKVVKSYDNQNEIHSAKLAPAPHLSFIKQLRYLHEDNKISELIDYILDFADHLVILPNSLCPSINSYITYNGIDKIDTSYLEEYTHVVNKLSSFLKVFNKDIKEIKLTRKKIDNIYHIRKFLVYEDGITVPLELESSSIRRLTSLFYPLHALLEQKIVLIDDLGINIHPVYLIKLLEALINNINGQLIFTTNNLEVIEVLKNNSYSLDFLSNDSVYSWKKCGNTSPLKNYLQGQIPNSNFEVSKEDFLASLKN